MYLEFLTNLQFFICSVLSRYTTILGVEESGDGLDGRVFDLKASVINFISTYINFAFNPIIDVLLQQNW